MSYTIHDLNSDRTAAIERWHEIRQSKKDELLVEMEKIWTTLSLSQKEALIQEATRALHLNQTIDRLRATKTDRWNHNEANGRNKMNVPFELVQLGGFVLFGVLAFLGGVSWGRKYPSKVEQLNAELKALKEKLR